VNGRICQKMLAELCAWMNMAEGAGRDVCLEEYDRRCWLRCVLGGFNVSNLMGITRRKIDIGKKITFYFLQNV
jgi:hypothetical protein